MDNLAIGSLLAGRRPTPVVVAPPPTEIVPYKIPAGIIDYVLANRYAGDRHPGEHLLYLSQLCSLFKLAGVSREFVTRKLFVVSLIDKASDWYGLLDNPHLLDWQELMSLFYTKFILFMKFIETGIISITLGLVTEKALLKLGGD